MARPFDITPVAPSVKLDDSRRGTVEFKVSNGLGKPARVRIRVVPEKPSLPGDAWFAPDQPDEWEKAMTADETAVFRINVSAPGAAAAGEYRFHLLAASVANPDEEYTEGPSVSFSVPAVVVKPFPWWIVIVGAAVLVVVGGLVAFLVSRGRTEVAVGTACKADGDCSSNQSCTEFSPGAMACLLEPQEACLQDRDCSSSWCVEGKCSRDDGKCDGPAECRAPIFACAGGLCLRTDGQVCSANPECQSGSCNFGRCGPPIQACAALCPPATRCIGGRCVRIILDGPFSFNPDLKGQFMIKE